MKAAMYIICIVHLVSIGADSKEKINKKTWRSSVTNSIMAIYQKLTVVSEKQFHHHVPQIPMKTKMYDTNYASYIR